MHRQAVLAMILIAALAASGCKRDAEPPAAAVAAPAVIADAAPGNTVSAVISEVDHNSPASAAPGFDAKAFAGMYAGSGTTLLVDAAGGYTLTMRADSTGGDVVSTGTWTAEADGRHVLLDPQSKEEADRRFEVTANNALRETGGTLVLTRGG